MSALWLRTLISTDGPASWCAQPSKNDADTQFGPAMQDLNIDVICANTAAAKGGVERAPDTSGPSREEASADVINDREAGNAFIDFFREDYPSIRANT